MTDTGTQLTETTPIVQSVELGVVSASSPAQLVARATEAANALAGVIEDKKLFAMISGRKFVKCEGWTTLAAMMGVLPREATMTLRDTGAYEATVELVRISDGAVLTRASAECGPDEPTWKNRAAYARRSMAATRATSKACRLAFSWVMALAGYEVTPLDEMPPEEVHPPKTEKAGRGQSPVGRPKDASIVTPPVQSLEEFPKQLEGGEPDPTDPGEKLMPVGAHKNAKLKVLSSKILMDAKDWMQRTKRYADFIPAIEGILKSREGL